ncbi:hypothetical protein JXM83_01020 [Candidatus Woesearchaeota archaeon]|nr:hypothetical protein [Candidatus Woesearchaeota archaeon]
MPDEYDDKKVGVRKFIHALIFVVFLFIFLYLAFWSKKVYTQTTDSTNETMRQAKDCMSYSFDVRQIYYSKGTLSFDFYLLGFSEDSVKALTIIPDKFYQNNNFTFVRDFVFPKKLAPGETKSVSVDIDINSTFDVMVKDCALTKTSHKIE